MEARPRMSTLSTLFMSVALVIVSIVVVGGLVAAGGLMVVNSKAGDVIKLAEGGIETIPELISSLSEFVDELPAAVSEPFNVRRAPEYVDALQIDAGFASSPYGDGLHPTVTVVNTGEHTVSLLALRVVALDEQGQAVAAWDDDTVATPLAIDDGDWRGPILPHATRRVVLSHWRGLPDDWKGRVTTEVEVVDVMVQTPGAPIIKTASTD